MSSSWKNDVWIYHERQEAMLCGQHALNNLVQTSRFSPDMLADIAHHLDNVELNYMADNDDGGVYAKDYLERLAEGSGNVDEQGNFSIEVLRSALKREYGLELPNIKEEGVLLNKDVTDAEGFICNKSSHWFAIRKINNKYWNLNSTAERPELISDFRLAAEIESLHDEGYSVFCVEKGLPPCDRDRGISEFWWKEGDLLSSSDNENKKDPWENMGSGNRLDGKATGVQQNGLDNMTEEQVMQMAVAASLDEQIKQVTMTEEPAEGAKGAVKIQFRLPNGKRVIRRFLETDPVDAVYTFADKESGSHFGQVLELRCGFPPKDLGSLKGKSIQEAKLSGEMIQGRFI